MNHETRTTTWEDPRTSVDVASMDLPKNWERRFDARTGKHYFINHTTKTTTFDDPRLEALAGRNETEDERNFRCVRPRILPFWCSVIVGLCL